MPPTKFRIFKILLLAGFTWIVFVILLHFHWEEVIERDGDEFDRDLRNPNEFLLNANLERQQGRLEMVNAMKKSEDIEKKIEDASYINLNDRMKKIQEIIARNVARNEVANVAVRSTSVSTEMVNTSLEITPSKKFSYMDVITTIPPEIIQQLGLTENRGEGGAGVNLFNVSPDIQARVDAGWAAHQFNEFVSDLISINRTVPDPRSAYCRSQNFLPNLPKTSVIIIFHNEAWSTLLR